MKNKGLEIIINVDIISLHANNLHNIENDGNIRVVQILKRVYKPHGIYQPEKKAPNWPLTRVTTKCYLVLTFLMI
jgi:hypothetical protein